jgi:hypothetical protein
MMGRYSEELTSHFKEMKTYVQCNTSIQGQKLAPRCEIHKHIFVFTYQLYRIFSLHIMMCINFAITVRLLQNNERGFPLFFYYNHGRIFIIELSLVSIYLGYTAAKGNFQRSQYCTRFMSDTRFLPICSGKHILGLSIFLHYRFNII